MLLVFDNNKSLVSCVLSFSLEKNIHKRCFFFVINLLSILLGQTFLVLRFIFCMSFFFLSINNKLISWNIFLWSFLLHKNAHCKNFSLAQGHDIVRITIRLFLLKEEALSSAFKTTRIMFPLSFLAKKKGLTIIN